MYSKMHRMCNPLLLKQLASHLKKAATEKIYFSEGMGAQVKRFPNGLWAPKLYMPSLEHLHELDSSVALYEPYTPSEISLLFPRNEWYNLTGIDGKTRSILRLP